MSLDDSRQGANSSSLRIRRPERRPDQLRPGTWPPRLRAVWRLVAWPRAAGTPLAWRALQQRANLDGIDWATGWRRRADARVRCDAWQVTACGCLVLVVVALGVVAAAARSAPTGPVLSVSCSAVLPGQQVRVAGSRLPGSGARALGRRQPFAGAAPRRPAWRFPAASPDPTWLGARPLPAPGALGCCRGQAAAACPGKAAAVSAAAGAGVRADSVRSGHRRRRPPSQSRSWRRETSRADRSWSRRQPPAGRHGLPAWSKARARRRGGAGRQPVRARRACELRGCLRRDLGLVSQPTHPAVGNHEYEGDPERDQAPGYFYFGAAAGTHEGLLPLGARWLDAVRAQCGAINWTRLTGGDPSLPDDCWPVSCASGSEPGAVAARRARGAPGRRLRDRLLAPPAVQFRLRRSQPAAPRDRTPVRDLYQHAGAH